PAEERRRRRAAGRAEGPGGRLMIRKPAADWGRESPAAGAARTAFETAGAAVATGRAAAATGGRILRGGRLCGFGALWLFAGLAAGAFSLPTLIGCSVLGLGAIAMGLNALGVRKPRAAEPDTGPAPFRMADAPAGRALGGIDYDRGKLLRM